MSQRPPPDSRLARLRQRMGEAGLDALLVSQPENRRYLSGFTGSAGTLLISGDRALLATDFRYVEQASAQAPDFQVVRIEGGLGKWFPEIAPELEARVWGFEASHLTVAEFQTLRAAARRAARNGRLRLVPTQDVVEPLRQVKDTEEVALIDRAAAITSQALEEVASLLEPGMTEAAAAWELDRRLREKGAQGVAFDTIVAAGPNAALPHHHPSERPLGLGETIVIDVGAMVDGYCCDMTRTLCLGEPDDTLHRMYDIVLGAQLTALSTLAPGLTGEEADGLARGLIEAAGHGQDFGHGLGHGVGLAVHEAPRLGKGSPDVLAEGMVFTVEPGIYLPGWGGVRIEDTVVLETGGARALTTAGKCQRA